MGREMMLHNTKITKIFWEIAKCMKQPPDAFLDMGPGIPNSEAWGARSAWPDCTIIGLEPNEFRFNSMSDVYPGVILRQAVAPKAGILSGFTGYSEYPEKHSDFRIRVAKTRKALYKSADIPCTTVDCLCDEYGPFSSVVIWADIEGSEAGMIAGATQALSSGIVKVVYVEAMGRSRVKVASLLSPYGFVMKPKVGPNDYIFVRNK